MAWYGFSARPLYNDAGHHHGFRATQGKKHVDIHIKDALLTLTVCGNTNPNFHLNPYAYYAMFKKIHKCLVDNWQAPNSSPLAVAPSKTQTAWFSNKVVKYWSKSICSEWRHLLQKMDPAHLDVARALFSGNVNSGMAAGECLLGRIQDLSLEHRQDIMRFVPAAQLADIDHIRFIGPDKITSSPIWTPAGSGKPQPSKTMAEIQDADASDIIDDEEEQYDNCYTGHKGDEDWRGYFCHDSLDHIPSNLTDTLERVRPGTAFRSVASLKSVVLDRVLNSKAEIVIVGGATSLHNKACFVVSSKEDILTSIKALNHKDSNLVDDKLSGRKTSDLLTAAEAVQYADLKSTQNMLKLTERAIQGQKKHKNRRKKSLAP